MDNIRPTPVSEKALENNLNIADLSKMAANRSELYEKICPVYDIPKLTPSVSLDYLKEILKTKSKFLKVPRNRTHPIPHSEVKRFKALDTYVLLEGLLKKHKAQPTGFNEFQMPDVGWMLRVICAIDPQQLPYVFNKKYLKTDPREKAMQEETIEIDPK